MLLSFLNRPKCTNPKDLFQTTYFTFLIVQFWCFFGVWWIVVGGIFEVFWGYLGCILGGSLGGKTLGKLQAKRTSYS